MQDLNSQQIVLLTLLVSFVTSIATGITTVSLLEKAPEPITQTINRIVEKTVERVVEVKDENNNVTVEKVVETVVINAEDLMVEAVSKNSDSLVRIFSKVGDLKVFVGIGIIITSDGHVLADARNIISGNNYVAQFVSGERDLSISFREPNNPFAVLKIPTEGLVKFSAVNVGDSQSVRLGQSVISLAGQSNNVVSTGIVSALDKTDLPPGESESSGKTILNSIDTNLDPTKINNGAMLLNLKGELIGIRIGFDQTKPNSFLPSQNIKDFVSSGVFRN
ncbi:MAG TPA: serine protease [Candidatus Paceibacterota bacterium]|nr:serine protease [Candidatus Paceibacterota bacterium]HMP18813.1 serine protease [Candidatus Paceibacterota bacterium]